MGDASEVYRPAFGLTDAEWFDLERVDHASFLGRGTKLADGPVRRRLKRLGLIASHPLNPPGMRCVAGFGKAWRTTEEGRKAATWRRAEVKP